MAKRRMDGFQKPIHGQTKDVGLAVIKLATTEQGNAIAECSCGELFGHRRAKVRDEKIQRHLDKKHGGRGLWL